MNNKDYRDKLDINLKGHYNKKVSEYLLSKKCINPFSTPGHISDITGWKSWMKTGFSVYQIIENLEYKQIGETNHTHVNKGIIETFPHACFTVLAGYIPEKKNMESGLEERIKLLHNLGFKNIRSVLRGNKHEIGDKLDALVAAYTGFMTNQGQVTYVGDIAEGQIVLPVPPEQIKIKYKRQHLFKESVKSSVHSSVEEMSGNTYRYIYTNVDSVFWFKYFEPKGHSDDISKVVDLKSNSGKKVKATITSCAEDKQTIVILEAMKNRTDGLKVNKEHKKTLIDFWGSHGDKQVYEVIIQI